MNIPSAYTDENASPEIKAVCKEIKNVIRRLEESSETARGCILNNFGTKVWEEPEDDYLDRMEEAGYLVIR